ncbi:hypothetical protein ACV3UV_12005 [Clostridium perfringens]
MNKEDLRRENIENKNKLEILKLLQKDFLMDRRIRFTLIQTISTCYPDLMYLFSNILDFLKASNKEIDKLRKRIKEIDIETGNITKFKIGNYFELKEDCVGEMIFKDTFFGGDLFDTTLLDKGKCGTIYDIDKNYIYVVAKENSERFRIKKDNLY